MTSRPPISDRTACAGGPAPHERSIQLPGESAPSTASPYLRQLVWVYFWLLIVEGALRKWILPQFSDALLIIRDPVVILIYISALAQGIFPRNGIVWASIALAIAALFAAPLAGQYNFVVTAYGIRTSFLHLPFVFLIPAIFSAADIDKIGKWLLISTLPMSVLVVLQFRAPSNHWLNVSVTGAATQITQGYDKIRPPGTFSFINGLVLYLSLVVAYLIAWQIRGATTHRKLAYAATLATGIMLATSGSRGALGSVALVLVGMAYVCLVRPSYFGKGVRVLFVIVIAFCVLQFRHEFRMGVQILQQRIDSGGGVRDGLVVRQLSGFISPIKTAFETPVLGYGIGMGTTVASQLIWGKRRMIFSEGEWDRIIRESGAILGAAYIWLRILLVASLAVSAHRALRDGNPLPILLFAGIGPNVLFGQWGASTILGFACFGAGLCLAACQGPANLTTQPAVKVSPGSVSNPARVRGRSIYSEKLHGR